MCYAEDVVVGDKVRGELKRGGQIQGNVISLVDSIIEIEYVTGGFLGDTGMKSVLTVSESELLYLDRLQGRRSHVFTGAFIGFLLGFIVGSSQDEGEMLYFGHIVGGFIGVLGGGAIGAALSSEKWISVDLAIGQDRYSKLDLSVFGVFRIAH